MWEVVVGPFPNKDEAARCREAVRKAGKGWWCAEVTGTDAEPAEAEVSASSTRFASKGEVERFAERLKRKGACRGKVRVKQVTGTEAK